MSTYNTGNPIGSVDVKDLYDNAQNLDHLVNDRTAMEWADRLGQSRKTWFGMEQDFYAFLQGTQFELPPLTYVDGAPLTVDRATQVIERTGQLYRIRLPASFPVVLSGVWATDEPLLSPMSDGALRQDLIDVADPTLGAGLVGRATRQVFSVDELRTVAGRYNRDMVELVSYYADRPGIGGGLLYWDASSTGADDNGKVFTGGVPTGRWKRKDSSLLHFDWWGIRPDLADNRQRLQQALDGTPSGCKIVVGNRGEKFEVNCPSAQAGTPDGFVSALYIDNSIRIEGGSDYWKLVDHCDAHNTWQADGTINGDVLMIRASKVEVKGLIIDANADNQYEVVGSNKYWEEGPTGVRPFNGIGIQAQVGQPAIEDVIIEGCTIMRPLAGVRAQGTLSFGGPALNDPAFLGGLLTTDIILNAEFRGNFVYRARGNDYLFNSGVRSSRILGNRSLDSQYHIVRFYAACIDCHASGNKAYLDYARIETRYNATDLGYWRSDNPADPTKYLIERSGYAIGSSYSNDNVNYCSMSNNIISYRGNISGAAVVDFSQITLASFFIWTAVTGNVMSDNESYNTPSYGLGCSIPVTSTLNSAQGVLFKNNKIVNSGRSAIWFIGSNVHARDNHFVNCNQPGSGLPTATIQGSHKIYKNTFEWSKPGVANTNTLFNVIQYGPVGPLFFISDNSDQGYTYATRLTTSGGPVVHGTDGGGVLFSVINSWNVNPSASDPDLMNAARVTINCAGLVTLQGLVGVTGTTSSDVIGNIPALYRPASNQFFGFLRSNNTPAFVRGRVKRSGDVEALRTGLASLDQVNLCGSWYVPLNLAA